MPPNIYDNRIMGVIRNPVIPIHPRPFLRGDLQDLAVLLVHIAEMDELVIGHAVKAQRRYELLGGHDALAVHAADMGLSLAPTRQLKLRAGMPRFLHLCAEVFRRL